MGRLQDLEKSAPGSCGVSSLPRRSSRLGPARPSVSYGRAGVPETKRQGRAEAFYQRCAQGARDAKVSDLPELTGLAVRTG